MERTVVLIKPDGVKRGIMGEIITRFEKVGLKIVAMKMVWVDEELVSKHYPLSRSEWVQSVGERTLKTYQEFGEDPTEVIGTADPVEIGKKVVKWLVNYLTSGPVLAMVLEGNHAIKAVRKMVGNTSPGLADPGTIRGDYSIDTTDFGNAVGRPVTNIIHASGSAEEAKFEEELWFHENEIHKYVRADEGVLFGK